jgi:hypothetical protein
MRYFDEYGPYDVQNDDLPHFGQVVYDFVKKNHWTIELFGVLYGKAVKNKPYTKMRIYQMIRENSLKDIEEAGNFALKGSRRDKGIYYIDRSTAYVASQVHRLHDTVGAFEALEEAAKYMHHNLPRGAVYMHTVEASVYFDKKCYPIATQLANEALIKAKKINSNRL